jgi:bla regulator protein blaR1
MTVYIIKTILCSGLFILVYKLLLEKENMHGFNRFYLLASLLASFLIPLLTFSYTTAFVPVTENVNQHITFIPADTEAHHPAVPNIRHANYQLLIAQVLYVLVTAVLLVRFIVNLTAILDKIYRSKLVACGNATLVLIDDDITPHSFLHYIFINRVHHESGLIRNEILLHEASHIRQKHSLDILFVEAVQVICWFNPFLIFYRRALLLNHEFSADQAVINLCPDIATYQHLLIANAGRQRSSPITSRFNYLITKKRLLMMTKAKSFRSALCRQMAAALFFALALVVFSTSSTAQQVSDSVNLGITKVPFTKEGITKKQMDEYEAIVNKYKTEDGKTGYNKITGADKERLIQLYLQMSREQQAAQTVFLMQAPPPLAKRVPSAAQFQSFKNAKVYGVWIDGKKVSNTFLNNHANTDFAQVFVSKLYGSAKRGRTYTHQVDLMTTAYYNNYYQRAIANKDKYFLAIRWDARKKPTT